MEHSFRSQVRHMGIFLGMVYAKIDDFLLGLYLSSPFFSTCHPTNAKQPRRISLAWSSPVLGVGYTIDISKVLYSVINPIAVHMVDIFRWPYSVVHKPRDSVRKILTTIDVQVSVLVDGVNVAGNISDLHGVAKAHHPSDDASLWVICKKRSNPICC